MAVSSFRKLFLSLCLIVLFPTSVSLEVEHLDRSQGREDALGCPGRYSCSNSPSDALNGNLNCYCDALCKTYDDCCEDFIPNTNSTTRLVNLSLEVVNCGTLGIEYSDVDEWSRSPWQELVNVVNRCPDNYSESHVRDKCHLDSSFSADQFFKVPVNGRLSKVLYRNLFCALCNGENDVIFWSVEMEISKETFDNLVGGQANLKHTRNSSQKQSKYLSFSYPRGYAPRVCQKVIRKCKSDWDDQRTKIKCEGRGQTTGYVQHNNSESGEQTIFRNKDCAKCNYVKEVEERCSVTVSDTIHRNFPPPSSYSIQYDLTNNRFTVKENAAVGNRSLTYTRPLNCKLGWMFDPFSEVCRRFVRPKGFVESGSSSTPRGKRKIREAFVATDDCDYEDEYQPHEYTLLGNGSVLLHVQKYRVLYTKGQYEINDENVLYACPPKETIVHNLTCIERVPFENDEYYLLDNQSIFIHNRNIIFNPGEYIPYPDHILVCQSSISELYANISNVTKDSNATDSRVSRPIDNHGFVLGVITFVGLLISLLSLLVLLIIYLIFSELRNTPGKCVICLAISLFVGQFSFLFAGFPGSFCFYLASIIHFAFLASFFWTNVLAFDICRTFMSALMRSDSAAPWKTFLCYSFYAWGVAGCIVGTCIAMDKLQFGDRFKPNYGHHDRCWITGPMALLLFFVIPVALILITNFIFFGITVYYLRRSRRESRMAVKNTGSKKSQLVICVKLSLILGITWTFSYIGNLTGWIVMWYLFTVFCSLQGVFLFITFVCTKKVYRLLKSKGTRVSQATGFSYGSSYSSKRTVEKESTHL